MSTTDPRFAQFLDALKAKGRSSPAGIHWQNFYNLLLRKRLTGQSDLPVPLILAASGEPDASKHDRLSAQLKWALDNGCLDEAMRYLESIPPEGWNLYPLDGWNRGNF